VSARLLHRAQVGVWTQRFDGSHAAEPAPVVAEAVEAFSSGMRRPRVWGW